MNSKRIPCTAYQGQFSDELVVSFATLDGERSFLVDSGNFIPDDPNAGYPLTGTVGTTVYHSTGSYLVVSVPGEPADLSSSKVKVAA